MKLTDTRHIPSLTNAEYHALPGISHSQIELFIDAPAFYRGRFIKHTMPRTESKAFDIGTLVHAILLQPETEPLVIIPQDVLGKNGIRAGEMYKQWKAEQPPGKTLMKKAEAADVLAMVESAKAEPRAVELLAPDGPIEHSLTAIDENSGLTVRARPDKISRLGGRLFGVDVKTCGSDRGSNPVETRAFVRACMKWGYFRQAAWYGELIESYLGQTVDAFRFIAIEKSAPFRCRVFEVDPDAIEVSADQNSDALLRLAQCLKTDDWLDESHGSVQTLMMPEWAMPDIEITSGGKVI